MQNAATYNCRTCDVTFDALDAFRQHAKSDEHVNRLRLRVEESGHSGAGGQRAESAGHADWVQSSEGEGLDESAEDSESESDDSERSEAEPPEFIEGYCLFCDTKSASLDSNTQHMAATHSFVVPHKDRLGVDLATLIWYLHLVVKGYNECLLCGTRRRTLEAVQHHMVAKGHCRFDVKGEVGDFYQGMDSAVNTMEDLDRPDEASIRLPSGKLLTNRLHSQSAARESSERRPANQARLQSASSAADDHTGPPPPSQSNSLSRRARKEEEALGTQLAQLGNRARMSLAHLSTAQQRSVLATRRKQVDNIRRAERRAHVRMGRKNNRTMMKHYKADGPSRPNG